ncbi:molybdenum cofactor biosynthesis protein MoaE [Myxococcota bacterium]|nr:molybdenum cofactor biosynthesis protein MoaE [Myxococcota bacterium]
MLALTDQPIDPRAVEAAVAHPGAGAIITFAGVTRDHFEGRRVVALHYEAYPELALPEMARIREELVARFPGARVAMVHRTGHLEVGEASVVIAVSAPHRGEAYEASRMAIDALKARVPVWKKEHYEDGQAWKENAEFHQALPVAEPEVAPEGDPSGARPPRVMVRRPFNPRAEEDYRDPDLNPYLKLHRSFGPEVIPAADGPGFRGRWGAAFRAEGEARPLHVEIGPGNGFFLAGMAARHPEWDWLGIEIRFKRVVLCAKKLRAAGIENARVLRYDAHHLDDLFLPGEVAGLYVNHPDPWTKGRNAKHRLLLRPFAEWCARALAPGASMRIKSDYHPNLDDFEALIEGLPLRVVARVDDIRAQGSPWGEDDVTTNYQSKFDKRGLPVAALWLVRDP